MTTAQLADVCAPEAAQLCCSSHRTSCELTSLHLVDLTLKAFSDALPHLKQDSLMLYTKNIHKFYLTDGALCCMLHTKIQESFLNSHRQAFKPVQIPTAFSKAFLQRILLKIANVSQKSLSIKSFLLAKEQELMIFVSTTFTAASANAHIK